MIRRFFPILLLLMVSAGMLRAQQYQLIDNLITRTETAPDSLLPRLYHDISWSARDVDPVMGVQYGLMAIEAAEEHDDYYATIMAYNVLAINERNLGNYHEALLDYRKALNMALDWGNSELENLTYTNIGNVYIYMNELDSAEFYERLALESIDSTTIKETTTRVYQNMALIAKKRGFIDSAIANLQLAYSIARHCDTRLVHVFSSVRELADIYLELNDYAKARDVLFMYINDIEGREDINHQSHIWFKLAQIYYKMGMLDSASDFVRKASIVSMNMGNVSLLEDAYKLLDSVCLANGNYRDAALTCRNFIDITDTVFNDALADQLAKIRYSSKFMENKRTLAKSKQDRRDRLVFFVFLALVIIVLAWGIVRIILTNRKAIALHADMDSKRASVLSSIKYASSIQKTVLPDAEVFGTSFHESFVLYMPRDIVSGDFYWQYSDAGYEMLAVADCTGHGVPGAILTMLGATALQDIAMHGERDAAVVLEKLRDRVIFMMGVNSATHMQDGMDISLIVVDKQKGIIDYAGAYNSLVYIRDDEYLTLKATRAPIGNYIKLLPFKSQKLEMKPGDVYYLLSDGFTSQFGGADGDKYPAKRFRQFLMSIHNLPMKEQKEAISREFHEWKGSEEQVDDVTIVGLRYL